MKTNIQKASLTAGFSLLIMTVLAFMIFPSLQATTLSIIGIAIIIILDVIVAISLYILLKPANSNFSFLTALFRIVYAIIFTVALIKMPDLNTFNYIWQRGLLVFGFHLLLLGVLIYKSTYIPKWLGILVIIASAGYIVDSLGVYFGYSLQIGMFTFIGELILMLWLLIKGNKIQISN
ncbi:DUF4386 domain-containing protein [bacterium]|nr:DUF4386 domain-containing protein [bacterium]